MRAGVANLRAAGASDVTTLRAGNLRGSADTPAAVHRAGLALDMSFDPAHGPLTRAMLDTMARDAANGGASPTVPLSCVEDFPGHLRHVQITALSFAEMRHALLQAVRESWPCFVILSHSFELLHYSRDHRSVTPHAINIRRWNRLLEFLAQHRDVMQTVGCRELAADPATFRVPAPTRTRGADTALRMGEQLLSRVSHWAPQRSPNPYYARATAPSRTLDAPAVPRPSRRRPWRLLLLQICLVDLDVGLRRAGSRGTRS